MSYLFLDANSSVLTARSSVTSGTAHEPIVTISSILTPVPVVSSGNQSVSGTVDIGTIPGSVLSQQLGAARVSVISSTPSSMLVGASIIGLTPVTFSGTPSISGAVTIVGNPSISGTVQSEQTGTRITSVVSSTPSSMLVGASIIGLTPVALVGTPSISGAVTVVGTPSISGAVTVIGNPSISGTVNTIQSGTVVSSIVNTVPSSVIVGASIFGQLPAGTAPLGSVATLQGTNPWRTLGSVSGTVDIGVSPGSVVAHQGTNPWVIGSIVGTYAEDAAHTSAEKGLFTLAVRNDTVASLASANGDYTPHGVDSAGRPLIKPFAAEEARIEGYISLTSTSVTTLVAAAGAGLRNYITDLWFANTGSVTTLVTLKDGGGSILGYTIAPAASGSNLPGLQTPIRTGANTTFDIQAASPTSTLYATVKGFKGP